ncbi:MAG TPA: aminotransferase class I/II-fold pyridoxal phosphate-dependent enzyme, partial [candidate division WOR-3 bacterium]|nr:aminotransferase class I/II-fold pyridoxal phosphate-dependent enzyme [candidate division WOR-3 bacterium]
YRELGRLGIKYFPSYTNFITLDFGINVEPINDALLKRGIIVRPLRSYGFDNYLRITIGTKKQNKKVIEALEGIVKSSI